MQAKRDKRGRERQRLRGAESLGRRGSVCGRSAGVRCCAHLRWPTPVRPSPDSCVKGRDFQIFWKEHRGPGCKSRSEGGLSTLWGPGRRQEFGRRQISMRSVEALEEDVALFGNVCAVQAQKRAARLKNASPCAPEKRDQPEIIKVLGKRIGLRGKEKSPFTKGFSPFPANSSHLSVLGNFDTVF